MEVLKNNLKICEKKINDLTRRIEKAGDERVSKGFPRYGGSRPPNRNNPIVTLSSDAAQIKSLIDQRATLIDQRANLKNEMQNILMNLRKN